MRMKLFNVIFGYEKCFTSGDKDGNIIPFEDIQFIKNSIKIIKEYLGLE